MYDPVLLCTLFNRVKKLSDLQLSCGLLKFLTSLQYVNYYSKDPIIVYLPGSSSANLAHSGMSEDSLDESDVVSAAIALGLLSAASAGGILGRTKSIGRDWLQKT